MKSRLKHPVRAIREPFGTAGLIVAVVALVFAMFGGAYAATNSSGGGKATASAKAKAGPRGKTGKTGPAGPAGPAGSAGPVGPKGDAGAAGTNGTNGTPGSSGAAGKSVKSESFEGTNEPVGEPCEEHGGNSFEVEGSGVKHYACNGANGARGPEGSPWVADTAPSNALLKGTWSIQKYTAAAEGEKIPVPISTGVPIGEATVLSQVIPPGETNNLLGCTGTAEAPVAPPSGEGFVVLCIYEQETNGNLSTHVSPGGTLQNSGGGYMANLTATAAGAVSAYGSWAMHAP